MAFDCIKFFKCVKKQHFVECRNYFLFYKQAKFTLQNMPLILQAVISYIVIGLSSKALLLAGILVAIVQRYPLEQRQLVPNVKPLVRSA